MAELAKALVQRYLETDDVFFKLLDRKMFALTPDTR